MSIIGLPRHGQYRGSSRTKKEPAYLICAYASNPLSLSPCNPPDIHQGYKDVCNTPIRFEGVSVQTALDIMTCGHCGD